MPQRPVAPGPGRDDDPGRVEEDWLAWCEAVEEDGSGGAWEEGGAGGGGAGAGVGAYAAARKHAAVGEFTRRGPRRGCPLEGRAGMRESGNESTSAGGAGILAESRHAADAM